MILTILFWILWFLWLIGCFFPLTGPHQRGHDVVLVGILGFKVFGSPLDK